MWYSDWQFWSAVVAFIALILSQLKPVKFWFQEGKLEFRKYKSFFIWHSVGSPQLHLFISLKNTGGQAVHIDRFEIELCRDSEHICNLATTGYISDSNSQNITLLTPIELKPDKTWAHTVVFDDKWNRSQQQKFRALASRFRDTINQKCRTTPLAEGEFHEADADDIQEIESFFNDNFKWFPGEYVGTLRIIGGKDEVLMIQKLSFTLFESESEELKSAKDDYKFGYGIYLGPSPKQNGIVIEFSH